MSNDFFKMRGIVKQYQMGNEVQTILKGIDLDIEEGEFLSILGPSGSGKSTLMNIIGCLDTPTSGEYILHGRMIRDLDENQLAHIRSKEIGFIFQQFQLLPRLDALKNVELPLIYAGVPPRERTRRAEEMLVRVGLKDRMHHYQNQLSGGQQQRVAIARALATNPTLLLADEPTGALDQATGEQVMALFRELNDEGRTIVMITHDLKIARHASRIVNILDGVLSGAGYQNRVNRFYSEENRCMNVGQCFAALDPTLIADDSFYDTVDDYILALHASGEAVLYPGEREQAAYEEAMRGGVALSEETAAALRGICGAEHRMGVLVKHGA